MSKAQTQEGVYWGEHRGPPPVTHEAKTGDTYWNLYWRCIYIKNNDGVWEKQE